MGNPLYRAVETAALVTDTVLVSFSGGKDSVVVLDLCMKHFKRVEAFFMHYVDGLSFQDRLIKYYETLYHIPIYRVPHFELSDFFRYGTFRNPDPTVELVGVKQMYDYMQDMTGIRWIAGGERIGDSTIRRAMIKSVGTINEVRGRFYPVAEWNKEQIYSYVKLNRLRIGQESELLGSSFGSLHCDVLYKLRQHYPEDYARILRWFPMAGAGVMNYAIKAGLADAPAPDEGEDPFGIPDASDGGEEA